MWKWILAILSLILAAVAGYMFYQEGESKLSREEILQRARDAKARKRELEPDPDPDGNVGTGTKPVESFD